MKQEMLPNFLPYLKHLFFADTFGQFVSLAEIE